MSITLNKSESADNNDSLIVLPSDSVYAQPDKMLYRYLIGLSDQALDRREQNYESLKAVDQINSYKKKMKQFFLEKLHLPEKTPLNARVINSKEYKDYRLEKIIYESQPRFYVPALLYLPVTNPPYPGVLVLCGHDAQGKAAYQEICIDLARNGMAALCPEPIGQGERNQILDENGAGIYSATTEHMIAGVAPILLGSNIASYMIWDGIRAIDYMCSRPDIDPQKIGCTGNSGGGNRTSYMMALDERISAAAPGCFITTTRRKNIRPGPGDAEQNIHAQIAFGMDHAEYIIMSAPKPVLILSATQDFVPIEGTWETFRQAKRIYTRLGFPERVDLVETDQRHGYSKDLRVGAVKWMRRWLMGKGDAVTETDLKLCSERELQCTQKGQVMLISGAKSVFDLNAEKEKILQEKRKLFQVGSERSEILQTIRRLTGIRKIDDLPAVKTESMGSIVHDRYTVDKLIFQWEAGIYLPALLFKPNNQDGDIYLYLHDLGKHIDASENRKIEKLVLSGNRVFAVDLRGTGETRPAAWRYLDAKEFTGSNAAEYFLAYRLNKSLLGMRAEDILTTARWLLEEQSTRNGEQIHLIACGEMGPVALHAMALEPEFFDSIKLEQSLSSWSDAAKSPLTRGVFNNTIHGALQFYDLPDLQLLIGPDKIDVVDPVNAQGYRIKKKEVFR